MPKLRCARATVDAEEERTIRKRDARRHVPGDGIRRARMVARSCEGLRTGAIAVTPGGQPQTVRARRARFNRRGRGGRRRNLMDKWAWIAMVGEEKARQDMGGQAFRRYVRAFNELSIHLPHTGAASDIGLPGLPMPSLDKLLARAGNFSSIPLSNTPPTRSSGERAASQSL